MTNLGTNYPEEWPDMIDVILATVDKSILEKEDLRPVRQLWWSLGVPWIRDLVNDGKGCDGIEKHPTWKCNEIVGADSSER